MSIISIPYTFSPGGTIVSSQVNSCFSTIYNDYNGSVGNNNLSPSIVITDTKLAQIVDASKVSGTALTGLASIPSGAGIVPIANLPSQFSSSVVLSAYNTGALSVTTTTQRTFNTKLLDSGGYFSSSTYTPLVAGWYLVNYSDNITSEGNGTTDGIAIYKNGSSYIQSLQTSGANTNAFRANSVTAIIQMNGSTDYLQFYVFNNGSDTVIWGGTGYNSISIVRVY